VNLRNFVVRNFEIAPVLAVSFFLKCEQKEKEAFTMAFIGKEEPIARRGKHIHCVAPVQEERTRGVRKVTEYVQPTAEDGYMGRFTNSHEHTSEAMQRRHPEIKRQMESKVFDDSPVVQQSKPRIRQLPESVLHTVQPPPDTRKSDAASKIGSGPSMVERMLNCEYPMAHPAHHEFQGHRNQPDFAKRRHESQIAIGGFQQLPPEPFKPNSGARRTVQVDYARFIPDSMPIKRFYTVDGRKIDGQQGVPILKNFFNDEPLLCNQWAAKNFVPPETTPRGHPEIPEPPHRRAPFDHGPTALV
jgi:hypothetical protein